jgi:8-oxo-dGTP pyrophosphatase MutT (NUDIX family)
VPAGRIEPGEAPRAAAARETREETGLDVACRRVLIRLRLGVGGTTYDIVDFEAVPAGPAVDGLPRVRVGDDAAVVRWVPLGEVAELPLAPGMTGLVDRLAAGGGPG